MHFSNGVPMRNERWPGLTERLSVTWNDGASFHREIPLPATGCLTCRLTTTSPKGEEDDPLATLPGGRQTFDGTTCDVRGVVQLAARGGDSPGDGPPEQVSGIQVNQRCRRLHFLHSTLSKAVAGTEVSRYVVHY